MLADATTNTNANGITHTLAGDLLTFQSARSDGFKRAFDAYPVKRDPAEAWKVWQQVIWHFVNECHRIDSDVEAWITAKVSLYAKSPSGKAPPPGDIDYRPSFANWLTKGKYEEPETEWQKNLNARGSDGNQGTGKGRRKKPAAAQGTEHDDSSDELFDQFTRSAARVAKASPVGVSEVGGKAGGS